MVRPRRRDARGRPARAVEHARRIGAVHHHQEGAGRVGDLVVLPTAVGEPATRPQSTTLSPPRDVVERRRNGGEQFRIAVFGGTVLDQRLHSGRGRRDRRMCGIARPQMHRVGVRYPVVEPDGVGASISGMVSRRFQPPTGGGIEAMLNGALRRGRALVRAGMVPVSESLNVIMLAAGKISLRRSSRCSDGPDGDVEADGLGP